MTTVVFDNGTGDASGRSTAPGSSRWWNRPLLEEKRGRKAKGNDDAPIQVHADLVPYVAGLMTAWARYDWFDRCNDRIYENRTLLSYRKGIQALAQAGFNPSRLAVTTSIVDTFRARFERRRPMPMLVVDDAEYDLRRQAEEFQSLLRGKMRELDVDSISSMALLHASVRGSGIAYIDEGEDDVIAEWVHRWELFVDPHESQAGPSAVRQIHRVRRMAREVLIAEYPQFRTAIMQAPDSRPRMHETGQGDEWSMPIGSWSHSDVIDVYESWHLPSCPYDEDDNDADDDIDDGRKAVCIEGATLAFDRWTRPRFPFAVLRRHLRPDGGFWGQGDVERLAEDQHDVNRVARDIQRNVEVNGNLIVFTPEAMDKTPTEKLTGRGPMRVRFSGSQAPAYVAPSPVSPAHLNYLEKRIAWMHDFSGVSQWSAQGRSPLGAGASGVAIDTMEDLQSDRHASFEASYSRWRCEVAQLILDACRAVALRKREEAKEAGEKKSGYGAMWLEHGTLKRLEWDTTALDEECYRIDIEPVSFIPATRAGKMAAIKELSGLNVWDPMNLLELFDEPDLASQNRETLAQRKNARRVMRLLADPKQEAPMPEPQWDLDLHKEMAKNYYCLAQTDGAPDEVVGRYRDYLDAVQDQVDTATAAAAPPPPPPMGAGGPPPPGGPPGPGSVTNNNIDIPQTLPPELGGGPPPILMMPGAHMPGAS